MTREENLADAKRRALVYLDGHVGPTRFRDTFLAMTERLAEHPENKGRYGSGVMLTGLQAATEENETDMRAWIEELQ